jgi:FAD/FMN-containing dehydrogenase
MHLLNRRTQWNGGGSHSATIARAVMRQGIAIPELRAALDGRVISPGDADYDVARSLFYGGMDRRPAVIIRPTDAPEVAAVIELARQTGLPLAVRSGGHSAAGHSVVDDGIVLDLSCMKALELDLEGRTAWAESGLTAGEYTAAVGEHGLVTGFGDTGSVGIGGITLGGGIGYLVRRYGLTIDSLLAAEIVTADGSILRVDNEEHPDLFWALRGGGGNFGVATRFKFQLHELEQIVGGMLVLPATPEVLAGFMALAEAAGDDLSTIANVMSAPPMPFLPPDVHGKLILMAMMVYAGPLEEAKLALAPFRALAAPLADMLRPMRYAEMFPEEEGGYHPIAVVGHNMFIKHVDQTAAETIVRYLEASDAPMRVAQLRALGGALARVPEDATAYAHRKSPIMVHLAAFYSTPAEKASRQRWIEEFAGAIDQGDPAVYTNFMGDEPGERVRAAYPGATWERLARVKQRYDPDNLFRLNQNIPPAD